MVGAASSAPVSAAQPSPARRRARPLHRGVVDVLREFTSATTAPTGTPPDPATIDHGPGETLLTGTTAENVKAAALAAVPGGTVIRVETDSGGGEYEAHVTKADGTQVTVKLDAELQGDRDRGRLRSGPGGGRPAPSGMAG